MNVRDKEKALQLHYSCSQDIGKCIRWLRIDSSKILDSLKFFIMKFLLQQPRVRSGRSLVYPSGPTSQLPSPVSRIPVTASTAFKALPSFLRLLSQLPGSQVARKAKFLKQP